MQRVRTLIIGAGVTGLAAADRLPHDDYLICEASDAIGGYCKTVHKDGFTWDYSGHFFHFKHPEIEQELVARMGSQRVLKIERQSRILWDDRLIDFPFQKNIHQLPQQEFIDCLVDLYFRPEAKPQSFKQMLYAKFGRSIADKFLVPYNEKLYAVDLERLDVDAMGRFFPHADVADIIGNFRNPDNRGYNATFSYPEGGAIQYVHALCSGVDQERIALSESVEAIDVTRRVARTSKREVEYEHLISSAPFVRLLDLTGADFDRSTYSWNKVLVFNLGFSTKGWRNVHWVYVPDREVSFYRVGFYDNIFGTDRMSLYVELGYRRDQKLGPELIAAAQARVLADLETCGITKAHDLVASHHVVMDPAYVHITSGSLVDVQARKAKLAAQGVHSIGRYGSWTYCSIEDNIIEARALVDGL